MVHRCVLRGTDFRRFSRGEPLPSPSCVIFARMREDALTFCSGYVTIKTKKGEKLSIPLQEIPFCT